MLHINARAKYNQFIIVPSLVTQSFLTYCVISTESVHCHHKL